MYYFTKDTKTYHLGVDGKYYVHDDLWGVAWKDYEEEIPEKEYLKAFRKYRKETSK